MKIMVWLTERPYEWRRFEFDLPPDACALVEAGLHSLNPFVWHPDYVQFIYEIGGYYEFSLFYWGCH